MRRLVASVLVAGLLAACTDTPSPDPTGTDAPTAPTITDTLSPTTEPPSEARVGVVVGPQQPSLTGDVTAGVASLERSLAGDAELRVVTADEPVFVGDMVEFLAADGYGLVCAVGLGVASAIRATAERHPDVRFCVAPADGDNWRSNILPIDVRVEEVGYLTGVAAATLASAAPVGVLSDARTHGRSRIEQGVREALRELGSTAGVAGVGPVADAEEAVQHADNLYEAGFGVLLSLLDDEDQVIVDAAQAASDQPSPETTTPTTAPPPPRPPPSVVGSVHLVPDEDDDGGGQPSLPEVVLAVFELHLDVAIRIAVERFVEQWSNEPVSVGLAEGAIGVTIGDGPLAGRVTGPVQRAADQLVGGERSVAVP